MIVRVNRFEYTSKLIDDFRHNSVQQREANGSKCLSRCMNVRCALQGR